MFVIEAATSGMKFQKLIGVSFNTLYWSRKEPWWGGSRGGGGPGPPKKLSKAMTIGINISIPIKQH